MVRKGYVRVSTKAQLSGFSIEEQSEKILAYYPDAEIVIEAYSGAKERPIFTGLIEELKDGDFLIVSRLDRFCRTTKEGLGYIDYLMAKNVKIHILNMGLIEDTPLGRMIVTCLLAFAEFDRATLLERMYSNKELARLKEGYREGHPIVHSPAKVAHALELLNDHSYTKVSEMTGISKSTLVRANRKAKLKGEV